MTTWQKFVFYGKKSIGGILAGGIFGALSFMFVEQQRVKGMTSGWVAAHDPVRYLPTPELTFQKSRPQSEEYARQRLQQELWVETLFADIPDETKERVTKRWTGRSYLEDRARSQKERDEFIERQVQKSIAMKESYKLGKEPTE